MWTEMYAKLSQIEDGWYRGLGNPRVEDTSRGPSEDFLRKIGPVIEGVFAGDEPSWYCACSGYQGGLELEWTCRGKPFDCWLSWEEETDVLDLAIYDMRTGEPRSVVNLHFHYTNAGDTAARIRQVISMFARV